MAEAGTVTEKQIRDCVRKWQARLGLDGWEIEVDFDGPPLDGAVMDISRQRSYRIAKVRLAPNWRKWTADDVGLDKDTDHLAADGKSLDRVVCHELIHLLLHDLDIAEDSIEDMVHRDVFEIWSQRRNHELERIVEEFARSFCRLCGE